MERTFGRLENHGSGSLLDSIDATLESARTMTWKGHHPVVTLATTTCQTGVTLAKKAMDQVETFAERLAGRTGRQAPLPVFCQMATSCGHAPRVDLAS